mmetsp:Transcript_20418/g.19738  ORF Transcript_20418/g.19738 Transcript_20418/m.19738 type:complete len:377 (-) Transcript_20418:224-1354(-)|eukprot:CAMPEP_0119047790 /NCGR_PEP_ID=MMETSP1177-20130426/54994_1 /TAXON_ID=2985 /ORGANISM="Ochromonas sp, Strain CCMP1899" /LENGTH=376 /DNA_ID=CAMNT_0007022785 /DNA_START=140 /DNA_END=1270 /DNA_ORIENTATION=-
MKYSTFSIFTSLVSVSSFFIPTRICSRQTQRNLLDISRLTTIEVADYVRDRKAANKAAPIVIAIGATEQHGPTGLIGTDSQTSLAVARQVCEENEVLLGPQLQIGMSLHHCGFAGSTSLRPSTLVNVICDIVWSLRQSSGFTHFYFINGHGGNVLPLKLAIAILKAKEAPWSSSTELPQSDNISSNQTIGVKWNQMVGVVSNQISSQYKSNRFTSPKAESLYEIEQVSWYANNESQSLARSLYGDEIGQHATPDEVSMTKFLFPELKKTAVLDPEVIKAVFPGRTLRKTEGGADVERVVSGLLDGISDQNERDRIMFLGKMALSTMDSEDYRKRFADGRMWSNPGLSTEEDGKLLFETSVKSVSENFKKFITVDAK